MSGGFATLLGFYTDVPLFYDQGTLHLDYLYNNGDKDNNAFKSYENIVSFWHQGSYGAFDVDLDLTLATGLGDTSDVFALTLLPTYDLAEDLFVTGDELRLAMRYHYAFSREEYGLGLRKRYEQKVTSGKGDSYSSYYIGLIYDIYKEKLKLMGGIEYFDMRAVADEDVQYSGVDRDVDGWSLVSGVRLYF